MSAQDGIKAIERFFKAVGDASYDHSILKNSKCLSAEKAQTVFELIVTDELCNSLGSMHGGALATAIDLFTTAAICPNSREGFWELGGVSRTLSVTYLRPAAEASKVLFQCKVVSLGKRTAALSCDVVDAKTKKVLAVGLHDKVNIDGPRI